MEGDVTAAANACRRFLQLEVHVETRVVAAALEILGMSSLDDEKPTKNAPPNSDATDDAKKSYLRRIASLVVDI